MASCSSSSSWSSHGGTWVSNPRSVSVLIAPPRRSLMGSAYQLLGATERGSSRLLLGRGLFLGLLALLGLGRADAGATGSGAGMTQAARRRRRRSRRRARCRRPAGGVAVGAGPRAPDAAPADRSRPLGPGPGRSRCSAGWTSRRRFARRRRAGAFARAGGAPWRPRAPGSRERRRAVMVARHGGSDRLRPSRCLAAPAAPKPRSRDDGAEEGGGNVGPVGGG